MKPFYLALAAIFLTSPVYAKESMTDNTNATAVFAGGCFWCMEAEFEALDGVDGAVSGYTGGDAKDATYNKISSGRTKHREAVEVTYDASVINYQTLLDIYISNVDPFDANGQFCDKGFQYTAAIYVNNDDERAAADTLIDAVQKKTGKQTAIAIEEKSVFYPAEDYHQNFYATNPTRYNSYKNNCGRKERLNEIKQMQKD